MPRSAAERQRLARQRARGNLIPARCWVPASAIERAIDSDAIAEAAVANPDVLGEYIVLGFLAWLENNVTP